MQDTSSQELVEHTLKLFSLAVTSSEAQRQPLLLRRFVQTVLEQGLMTSA